MNWRIAATVLFLLLPAGSGAQLVEGEDYIAIDPRPVAAGERVEVIEFFFYGCRSCYLLEPVLRDWVSLRAEQIDFRLIPALRRAAWVPLSDLFFALYSLGVLPRMHDRVYVAIHEHKRLLSSRSEQVRWASDQGLNAAAFEAALAADATLIATQQARDATVAYGIRATPTLVFDGRYITTGEMIGNATRVPQVLDRLLQMARTARGSGAR